MENPDIRRESGRNMGERVGALEQDMKVVKHQIQQFERRHETAPERLGKLEQQFAHLSDDIGELKTGVAGINAAIGRMGTKMSYAVGIAVAALYLFDKFWPIISAGFKS